MGQMAWQIRLIVEQTIELVKWYLKGKKTSATADEKNTRHSE